MAERLSGVSVSPYRRLSQTNCSLLSRSRERSPKLIQYLINVKPLCVAYSPVWSKNSCGLARVVFQQPAEPFATLNGACTLYVWADRRKEEHIVLALMVPLVMKMRHILRQCVAERRFPKQDKSRQALFFDGAHPALRVGVQIRRPRRQEYPRDPGCVNEVLK